MKCLFPAAGYGTRFLPATKAVPKEMLPVVDKPLIQYGVEEALEAGIKDMGFVISRNKEAITDHFDMAYEVETQIAGTSKEALIDDTVALRHKATFATIRQIEMRGLGHAILKGEAIIGHEEPFGVILADDLCEGGVLGQLVEVQKANPDCSVVAIQEIPKESIDKYGVIAGELLYDNVYKVDNMVEKPNPADAPSNFAIIGRYVLTPDIFDFIRETPEGKGGEIQITDALMKQAIQGRVLAVKYRGTRFDCGTIDGFVEATNYFYAKRKATQE